MRWQRSPPLFTDMFHLVVLVWLTLCSVSGSEPDDSIELLSLKEMVRSADQLHAVNLLIKDIQCDYHGKVLINPLTMINSTDPAVVAAITQASFSSLKRQDENAVGALRFESEQQSLTLVMTFNTFYGEMELCDPGTGQVVTIEFDFGNPRNKLIRQAVDHVHFGSLIGKMQKIYPNSADIRRILGLAANGVKLDKFLTSSEDGHVLLVHKPTETEIDIHFTRDTLQCVLRSPNQAYMFYFGTKPGQFLCICLPERLRHLNVVCPPSVPNVKSSDSIKVSSVPRPSTPAHSNSMSFEYLELPANMPSLQQQMLHTHSSFNASFSSPIAAGSAASLNLAQPALPTKQSPVLTMEQVARKFLDSDSILSVSGRVNQAFELLFGVPFSIYEPLLCMADSSNDDHKNIVYVPPPEYVPADRNHDLLVLVLSARNCLVVLSLELADGCLAAFLKLPEGVKNPRYFNVDFQASDPLVFMDVLRGSSFAKICQKLDKLLEKSIDVEKVLNNALVLRSLGIQISDAPVLGSTGMISISIPSIPMLLSLGTSSTGIQASLELVSSMYALTASENLPEADVVCLDSPTPTENSSNSSASAPSNTSNSSAKSSTGFPSDYVLHKRMVPIFDTALTAQQLYHGSIDINPIEMSRSALQRNNFQKISFVNPTVVLQHFAGSRVPVLHALEFRGDCLTMLVGFAASSALIVIGLKDQTGFYPFLTYDSQPRADTKLIGNFVTMPQFSKFEEKFNDLQGLIEFDLHLPLTNLLKLLALNYQITGICFSRNDTNFTVVQSGEHPIELAFHQHSARMLISVYGVTYRMSGTSNVELDVSNPQKLNLDAKALVGSIVAHPHLSNVLAGVVSKLAETNFKSIIFSLPKDDTLVALQKKHAIVSRVNLDQTADVNLSPDMLLTLLFDVLTCTRDAGKPKDNRWSIRSNQMLDLPVLSIDYRYAGKADFKFFLCLDKRGKLRAFMKLTTEHGLQVTRYIRSSHPPAIYFSPVTAVFCGTHYHTVLEHILGGVDLETVSLLLMSELMSRSSGVLPEDQSALEALLMFVRRNITLGVNFVNGFGVSVKSSKSFPGANLSIPYELTVTAPNSKYITFARSSENNIHVCTNIPSTVNNPIFARIEMNKN